MNASTFTARVVASTGVGPGLGGRRRRSARSRARSTAARPGRCSTCSTPSATPTRAGRGSRRSSAPGGASWAWATASTACAIRAPPSSSALGRLQDAIERGAGGADAARVSRRLALARAVEREAAALLAARHPDRPLRANVEFYTAVLLDAVGLPRELFSATFAAARAAGWTAHVDEQRRKGRLIRPTSILRGALPA